MSHYKYTNITNWEPNNMSMDGHLLDHDQYHQIIPFDHTNRSNYPLIHENHPKPSTSTQTPLLGVPTLHGELDQVGKFDIGTGDQEDAEEAEEELGSMKEMVFKIAAMQPIDIDPTTVRKPKRRNVRISDDPQSIAARHRRKRISEKIGILQRIVPGGTKMDTASMLDEAIRYMKFLKRQIGILQANPSLPPSVAMTTAEDWAGLAGTSYMFGGNNINNDGTNHHDDPMCFNNKFN